MSLVTALTDENSHILAGIYVIFLKERPRLTLNSFQYQIWNLTEKIWKVRQILIEVRQILALFFQIIFG